MKKIIALAALVLLFAACSFEFPERPEPVVSAFVPVEEIIGIPSEILPYAEISLSKGVKVTPENATYRKIEWSKTSSSGTEAELLNGRWLSVTEAGTVTVTATIKNGSAEGADYTQDFEIEISP
jgi:endo-1,4-beta-xylanase